jgi:predicted PurR-regulated permease PerM
MSLSVTAKSYIQIIIEGTFSLLIVFLFSFFFYLRLQRVQGILHDSVSNDPKQD